MEHGAIRVMGVNSTGVVAGNILICDNGIWRTVCDDGWDLEDAQVVCRQLGFYGQGTSKECLHCP